MFFRFISLSANYSVISYFSSSSSRLIGPAIEILLISVRLKVVYGLRLANVGLKRIMKLLLVLRRSSTGRNMRDKSWVSFSVLELWWVRKYLLSPWSTLIAMRLSLESSSGILLCLRWKGSVGDSASLSCSLTFSKLHMP